MFSMCSLSNLTSFIFYCEEKGKETDKVKGVDGCKIDSCLFIRIGIEKKNMSFDICHLNNSHNQLKKWKVQKWKIQRWFRLKWFFLKENLKKSKARDGGPHM